MRTTLQQAKESRIPVVLNLCASDARVVTYINEAQERLASRGRWVGTTVPVRFCVSSGGCITWPRQIASIEAFAINSHPGKIRDLWFEYLPNGYGIRSSTDGDQQLFDRGFSPVFDDIVGTDKNLRVYADVEEAAGIKLRVLGYDENGNWIRTQVGGVWEDGELIPIVYGNPAISTKIFTSIVGVQKPVTNGNVRLYSYLAPAEYLYLGNYAPDETNPSYRRSLVPGLQSGTDYTLDAMVRLKFIPATKDTDYLFISNLAALKDMVTSIKMREANRFNEAELYEQSAIRELEKELEVYGGAGTIRPPRVEHHSTFGGGGVTSLVGANTHI